MENSTDRAQQLCDLGKSLMANGQIEQSLGAFSDALKLRPGYAEALFHFGNALFATGRVSQSLTAYRHCIATGQLSANLFNNYSVALTQSGELEEALTAGRKAIALQPHFPEAYLSLGNVLQAMGQNDQALTAYRQSLSQNPGFANTKMSLGLLQLKMGEFRVGWQGFEARLECFKNLFPVRYPQPQWDGKPLAGKRILIRAEQGFGDTIQFARYLPMVAALGGRVMLQCQPELHRIFRGQLNIERLLTQAEDPGDFDVQCPLMSLAGKFGTTLETIPAAVPYLVAEPERVKYWRSRLEELPASLKVGLVWSGRPTNKDDSNRSVPFELLSPLLEVPGVQCVSLQKGEAAARAKSTPLGSRLMDWTGELTDFAETAALISALDLVITVDTAVAHLAGALGLATTALLPCSSDWRWLVQREDSPWYPTMRLFRQSKRRDWPQVIGRVATELARNVNAKMG